MAGNRTTYTFQINADAAQAKRVVEDLNRSFENLRKAQSNNNYLDAGINQAVRAAKELEVHLEKAVNVNTGKLNLNALNASLKESNQSISQLTSSLLQGGRAGQDAFLSLAQSIAASEVPMKQMNKALKDFGTTIKNTVKWEISSNMVHGLESALTGAVGYAKDLNRSLNDIRIVTGQSVSDMARFAQEANRAAKELSTTTKAYADASLIYYQQGDNAEQAAKKAAITIKAANASFGSSASEMSEYLTAVWNSYKVGADELERYVDIMAALGAKTATSLEEIATSMQKVAATASTVGVSMEQLSSIISTVSSVTRESAESIGTAYKTIFARIGDLKLGKTLEDGETLGQVSSQLETVGIHILDTNGELRDMGAIVEELGSKWQSMSRATQTAVAQAVAGKRQYTQLMALFENWDMYSQNMNIAQNADGSLQEMADIYAESWEAASARAQAAMEGIYSKVLNDEAIIKMTNAMTAMVEVISEIIDGLGGMGGLISQISATLINVFQKEIAGSIDSTIGNISTYISQFKNMPLLSKKNSEGKVTTRGFFSTIYNRQSKSVEQIRYEESQKEWSQQLEQVSLNKGANSPEAISLNTNKELLQLKHQLTTAENTLSEAQRSRATVTLSQIQQEQQALVQLAQERETTTRDYESDILRIESLTARIFGRGSGKNSEQARAEIDEAFQIMGQLTNEEPIHSIHGSDVQYNFNTMDDFIKMNEAQSYRNQMAMSFQEAVGSVSNLADEKSKMEALNGIIQQIKDNLQSDSTALLKNIDTESQDAATVVGLLNERLQKVSDASSGALMDLSDIADGVIANLQISADDIDAEALKQALKQALDKANAQGDFRARVDLDTSAAKSSLDKLKKQFQSIFGQNSPLTKTTGQVLTKIGSYTASITAGWQAGTAAVEAFGDETASLTQKITAASGAVNSLVQGFMSGGWVGLALSTVALVVSGIIEANEQAKEAYQEQQKAAAEKQASTAQESADELKNNQALINNYNELYEVWDRTKEGQDAVKNSALELAKAYDIVGASILIASGQFDKFNERLIESMGFEDSIAILQKQRESARSELDDHSKNSQYRLNNKATNWTYYQEDLRYGYGAYDSHKFTPSSEFNVVLGDREGASGYEKVRKDEVKALHGGTEEWMDSNAFEYDTWVRKTKSFHYELTDLDKMYSDILDAYNGDREGAVEAFIDLCEELGIMNKELADMIEAEAASIDGASLKVSSYFTSYDSATTSWDIAQKKFEDARDEWVEDIVLADMSSQINADMKKYYTGEDAMFATDYTEGIFDEYGTLIWNQEGVDSQAQWKKMESAALAAGEELGKVNEEIDKLLKQGYSEDDPVIRFLKSRASYLTGFVGLLNDQVLNNEAISNQLATIGSYDDQILEQQMLQQNLAKFLGKTYDDISFSEYVNYTSEMTKFLFENAKHLEAFKEYLPEDAVLDGNVWKDAKGEVIDTTKLTGAISDYIFDFITGYTSFDDFALIDTDLRQTFTNSTQYAKVHELITATGIKNSEMISDAFVNEVQYLLNNGTNLLSAALNADGSYNTDTQLGRIMAQGQRVQDFKTAKSGITTSQNMVDQLKEDMTWDEATAVYDNYEAMRQLLGEDQIKSWDEFVAMSYTEQEAYLTSVVNQAEEKSEELLGELIQANEQIIQGYANLSKTEGMSDEAALAELDKKIEQYTVIRDEIFSKNLQVTRGDDGTFTIKNAEGKILDASEHGFTDEQLQDYWANGKTYESVLSRRAENEGYRGQQEALKLLGDGAISTEEKISRCTNAINIMQSGLTEFIKTGKMSVETLTALGKAGINTSQIKTTQDYIQAMKQLAATTREQAALAKAEYDKTYGTQYGEFNQNNIVQQDGEDNDAYAARLAAWERVMSLFSTEEDTTKAWQDAILSVGETRISNLEARMQELKDEAQELQAAADTLSGAIHTGDLTEQQRLSLTQAGVDLTQWDAAATAAERAAIAADVHSQATAKAEAAVEEMVAFYDVAITKTIDWSNSQKKLADSHLASQDSWQKYLTGRVVSGLMSEDEMSAWLTAYKNIESQITEGMDVGDVYSLVIAELRKMGDEAAASALEAAAKSKDSIVDMYSTIRDEHIAAADEAAAAWESAFKRIAEARQTLLSGGNLLEEIAYNPEALLDYYFSYLKGASSDAMSIEDFAKAIISGDTSIAKLMELPKFVANQAKYGFDLETSTGEKYFGRKTYQGDRSTVADSLGTADSKAIDTELQKYYQAIIDDAVSKGLYTLPTGEDGKAMTSDALASQIISSSGEGWNQYIQPFADIVAQAIVQTENAGRLQTDRSEAESQLQVDRAAYDEVYEKESQDFSDWQAVRDALWQQKVTGEAADIDEAVMRRLTENGEFTEDDIRNMSVDQAEMQMENSATTIFNAASTFETAVNKLVGEGLDPEIAQEQREDVEGQVAGIGDEINEWYNDADKRIEELQEAMREKAEKEAEAYDLELEQIEDLAEILMATNEAGDDLADSLDEIEAAELAKDILRYGRAVEQVTENYKDWMKALDSDNVIEQTAAAEDLDKAYSDMLDLDYGVLSKKFLLNTENLNSMKDAANGSEEAYADLQEAARQDIAMQVGLDDAAFQTGFDNLMQQYYQGQNLEDLEVGASLNDTEFLNALSEMVTAAGMTAAQATSYLSSMGVDAEIIEQPAETTDTSTYTGAVAKVGWTGGSATYPVTGGMKTSKWRIPSITYDTTSYTTTDPKKTTGFALKVTSANKSSGGGFKHTKSGGGGGKSGGGGGGGGGSKKETKQLVRSRDVIERYHKPNQQLDRSNEQLEKIAKLKDRAYGGKYIKQLEAETAALQKQADAQAALYNEANKWLASDRAELMSLNVGVQFDEDGNISNYEQVVQRIIDRYNEAIQRYNNSDQNEGDKARLEADEQAYQDALDAIENYEEAVQTANDALNEMEEIKNQLSEIELEKIVYKLEIQTTLNDNDIELLEYFQDKYEDSLKDQDELFANVADSMGIYQQNLTNLSAALDELNTQHSLGAINEADYAEGLQEIRDQIMDNLSSLEDAADRLKEIYADALNLAAEEIGKVTDQMEHSKSVMESYISIMGLMGQETDYKALQQFYDAQAAYGMQQIDVQKAHYDELLRARQAFDDKIAAGIPLTEIEKENYEALQEQINETYEGLLGTTQSTLEAIRAGYENTVSAMSKELEEFMAGTGNSIAHLTDQYATFQEQQERYVSTATELYEVSKLNREIEASLSETMSAANKEALKALQEEINLRSEKVELTEYDIQMNRLQYELLLARIKLEEASSSKDTVRLTRDANGNYAYQYTANQDKVNQAAQEYEDVLQKINELTVERTSEIEQEMMDAMQTALDQMNTIMLDTTLTQEQQKERLAEIAQNFKDQMDYLNTQAGIASGNLLKNQTAIAEQFGVDLSTITSSAAGNANEAMQSILARATEIGEKFEEVLTGDGDGSAAAAIEAFRQQLADVAASSGTSYTNMTNAVGDFTTANENAAASAENVLDTLRDTLGPLTALTAAWGVHASTIENMIAYYEALADAINGTLQDEADVGGNSSGGSTNTNRQFEDKGYGPYEVTLPDGTKVTYNASSPWSALAMAGVSYSQIANVNVVPRFKHGGLVDFTGLAQLDGTETDPEMVLNPEDTQNMLTAVRVVRKLDTNTLALLVSSLNLAVESMLSFMGGSYSAGTVHGLGGQTIEQDVHITADFPNVTDHNEIEEAFNTLVNRAAQFAKMR